MTALRGFAAAAIAVAIASSTLSAQSAGPKSGWLVLAGGAYGPGAIDRFRELSGGSAASIVYIPSASSGIKLPSGFIWIPPEESDATNNTPAFERELTAMFGVQSVRVLHSRKQSDWNSDAFASVIGAARSVWISEGNAGRIAGFVLGTKSEQALRGVLDRDGVIGGTSAGAIFTGSVILRGRSDKPVTVARGFDRGLSLITNAAINPHLTESKRESELIAVVDARPGLLGIGVDEQAALVVRHNAMTVIGSGRVAIYDDQQHGKDWFYYLPPGSTFDLASRRLFAR